MYFANRERGAILHIFHRVFYKIPIVYGENVCSVYLPTGNHSAIWSHF